jgi:hypothetical protein
LVEISDEVLDLCPQGLPAGEVASAKKLAHQDGEPNLDLIEPRSMFGREVEGDAMLRVAQECLTGRLGCENA